MEIRKILEIYGKELAELEERVKTCREQKNVKSCIDCKVACSGAILREVANKLDEMRIALGLSIIGL
jgi:hypothetical protein